MARTNRRHKCSHRQGWRYLGTAQQQNGTRPKTDRTRPKGVRLADAISSGKGVLSRQVAATPRPCPCG
jgi:hypothetical protein